MNKEQKHQIIQRLVLAVLAILAAVALMSGVTLAWFTTQNRISSVGKIHPLSSISIMEPGDAVIQAIDLSYDKSEVDQGIICLKRPFVIQSETPYYDLCIAHTTNISGLSISLYVAADAPAEEQDDAYVKGVTEKGSPYYWNKANGKDLFETDGRYLNRSADNWTAAKDHDAHKDTFRMTGENDYKNVQKNAEPLYWVSERLQGEQRTPDIGNFYTNYILEISWNETDKETDILYVIAQTNSYLPEEG